ncbi:hypothetical protein K457DRAFT_135758 [Linnemannia elongata AG-77]|uniref:Secreted protein n=1 Tax=Linnemannia elongata AG-77 TaxID=1314771 RepID=A0A197K303_9FUNG|nr:hypothetical protein K457DRAFT_135758 [Linnemannia elongata AG-77]
MTLTLTAPFIFWLAVFLSPPHPHRLSPHPTQSFTHNQPRQVLSLSWLDQLSSLSPTPMKKNLTYSALLLPTTASI